MFSNSLYLLNLFDPAATKLKQYSAERLRLAITEVRQGRMTLSAAARYFDIPSSTLSDRVRKPLMGTRAKMLTAEEEKAVVEHCRYRIKIGRPLKRKEIREHIKVLL